MKQMSSKAFHRKQNTQYSFSKHKKNHVKKVNNLTVFQTNHSLRICYGTDGIPPIQTAVGLFHRVSLQCMF